MERTLLLIGAHPDDCDIKAGGMAARAAGAGHAVHILSVTDGSAGHHEQSGDRLVARRRREAEAAAAVIGAEFHSLGVPDGRLRPTLERRDALLRFVREIAPDVVLTHRPVDYHPDHRYTAQLVRDSSYMLTVPNVCPDTPHLAEMPVIGHFHDGFTNPTPFAADIVVNVDPVLDRKVEMIHRHESQLYEWLPYNTGTLDAVPEGEAARKAWIREERCPFFETFSPNAADLCRAALRERYGEAAAGIGHAEAVELSEYGASLSEATETALFGR